MSTDPSFAEPWFPEPSPHRCPGCGGPVAAARCGSCGLVLTGGDAAAIWRIDGRLHALGLERRTVLGRLRARSAALARADTLQPLPPPPPPPPPFVPFPPIAAQRPARADAGVSMPDLLLTLGTGLVVVAAIVFAAVSWSRLGAAVQGLVLMGLTAAAIAGTRALAGRGLRATAEAIGVVAVALLAVDAHAVREASGSFDLDVVAGGDGLVYWCLATWAVVAAAWWLGRMSGTRAPAIAAAVGAQLPVPLYVLVRPIDARVALLACLAQVAIVLVACRSADPAHTTAHAGTTDPAHTTPHASTTDPAHTTPHAGTTDPAHTTPHASTTDPAHTTPHAGTTDPADTTPHASTTDPAHTAGLMAAVVTWTLTTAVAVGLALGAGAEGLADAVVVATAAAVAGFAAWLAPAGGQRSVFTGAATVVGLTAAGLVVSTVTDDGTWWPTMAALCVAVLGAATRVGAGPGVAGPGSLHLPDGPTWSQHLPDEAAGPPRFPAWPGAGDAGGAAAGLAAPRTARPPEVPAVVAAVAGTGAALLSLPLAVAVATGLGTAMGMADEAWRHGPWTGSLALAGKVGGRFAASDVAAHLAVAGLAVAVMARRIGARAARAAAALVAAAAVVVAPVLVDTPVVLVVGVIVAAAYGALAPAAWPGGTRRNGWAVSVAAALAAVALGWAAAAPVTTLAAVAAIGALAVWVGVLAVRDGAGPLAHGAAVAAVTAAVALAGLAASALGADAGAAWTVAALAAVGVSAASGALDPDGIRVDLRGGAARTADGVAAALHVLALAVVATAEGPATPALTTLVLAAGATGAAVHALRPGRRAAAVGAAVEALVLVWWQLAVAGVDVPEAYTLPVAATLLGGALVARRLGRTAGVPSWTVHGPWLVAAVTPTVLLALGDPGLVRPLAGLVAGVVVLTTGAVTRTRAAVDVGAATVAVLGLHQLSPVVAELPNWLTLGACGVALLVVGATFEERRRDLGSLLDRYGSLR